MVEVMVIPLLSADFSPLTVSGLAAGDAMVVREGDVDRFHSGFLRPLEQGFGHLELALRPQAVAVSKTVLEAGFGSRCHLGYSTKARLKYRRKGLSPVASEAGKIDE